MAVVFVQEGVKESGEKLVATVTEAMGNGPARGETVYAIELTINGARAALDMAAYREDAVFTAQLMVFSRLGAAS